MKLKQGLHLAYCTNIHRGETWSQTFETLCQYTLAVRNQLGSRGPFAIGLRLGCQSARELAEPATLKAFQAWLDRENCYVFTINGFPYGRFHGGRVKEDVYSPDWTTQERLDYTLLLFELLSKLVPAGVSGSVSTVPGSYKEFITSPAQEKAIRDNLWRAVEGIERLSQSTGRDLHLGVEPEPLCYLETTEETLRFFEQLRADRPGDDRIKRRLGINYDCCHLAIEYEDAGKSLASLAAAGIRLSKLHFSAALKVRPTPECREALKNFVEPVYFHQVIERPIGGGDLKRYRDLDLALAVAPVWPADQTPEWRIHFHIPLHQQPSSLFGTTADHLLGAMDFVQANPGLCEHIEMETYTWEVLPSDIKNRSVVDQLVGEYRWTLGQLAQRGLA